MLACVTFEILSSQPSLGCSQMFSILSKMPLRYQEIESSNDEYGKTICSLPIFSANRKVPEELEVPSVIELVDVLRLL